MQTDPKPPLLLIRENIAFGLEGAPISEWSATPQALAEGCFKNSFCLDEGGNTWRILHAELRDPPGRLSHWMRWRRVPVEITLDSLPKLSVNEVVRHLITILKTENDFCESLGNPGSLAELERHLEGCTTLPEIFQLVGRYAQE